MSMRTIIVDDEAPARLKVKQYLKDNPDVEIIGEADNGADAVREINEKKPDLVILDIQMPEMDGFEVIKALSEPPLIIFATAYDQYAIQAFEVNSIDYLLKPFKLKPLYSSRQIPLLGFDLIQCPGFQSIIRNL